MPDKEDLRSDKVRYCISNTYVDLAKEVSQGKRIDVSYFKKTRFADCVEGSAVVEVEAALYRKALRIYPDNIRAIEGLISCLLQGAMIKREDSKGTLIEGTPKVFDHNNLSMELCRKILKFDPDNAFAIFYLAYFATNNTPMFASDLQETRFKEPTNVSLQELKAELYRRVLRLSPNNISAILNLGICLEEGAQVLEEDLEGTSFVGQNPEGIPPSVLAADLYQKALQIEPSYMGALRRLSQQIIKGVPVNVPNPIELLANLSRGMIMIANQNPRKFSINEGVNTLASAVLNGACLQVADLRAYPVEGFLPSMSPIEWAARVYRVLRKDPYFYETATKNLSVCFLKGAVIYPNDLVGTQFQGQDQALNLYDVVAELEKKSRLPQFDPPKPYLIRYSKEVGEPSLLVMRHPKKYLCTLSGQLMENPVLLEGGIFEAYTIDKYLKKSKINPLTGRIINNIMLVPFPGLKEEIEQYVERLTLPKESELKKFEP